MPTRITICYVARCLSWLCIIDRWKVGDACYDFDRWERNDEKSSAALDGLGRAPAST
jgi:hypothetical protein